MPTLPPFTLTRNHRNSFHSPDSGHSTTPPMTMATQSTESALIQLRGRDDYRTRGQYQARDRGQAAGQGPYWSSFHDDGWSWTNRDELQLSQRRSQGQSPQNVWQEQEQDLHQLQQQLSQQQQQDWDEHLQFERELRQYQQRIQEQLEKNHWHRQQWHSQRYGHNAQSSTRSQPRFTLNSGSTSTNNNPTISRPTILPADFYYHELRSDESNSVAQQQQPARWHQEVPAHSEVNQQQQQQWQQHESYTSTTSPATILPADFYYHELRSNESNSVAQQQQSARWHQEVPVHSEVYQQQQQQWQQHESYTSTTSPATTLPADFYYHERHSNASNSVAQQQQSAHWHQEVPAHSEAYEQQHQQWKQHESYTSTTTITTDTSTAATTTTTSFWYQQFLASGQEQQELREQSQQIQHDFSGTFVSAAPSTWSNVDSPLLLTRPLLQDVDDYFQEHEMDGNSSANQESYLPSFFLELVTCARQQAEKEQERYRHEYEVQESDYDEEEEEEHLVEQQAEQQEEQQEDQEEDQEEDQGEDQEEDQENQEEQDVQDIRDTLNNMRDPCSADVLVVPVKDVDNNAVKAPHMVEDAAIENSAGKAARSERAKISVAQALGRVIAKEYLARIARTKSESGSGEMNGIRHHYDQQGDDDEDDEDEEEDKEREQDGSKLHKCMAIGAAIAGFAVGFTATLTTAALAKV